MTKKKMVVSTGLYALCTLIWTFNFFLHWQQDGMINFSTALFGLAAALFAVATVLGVVRMLRQPGETTDTKEEK